MTMIKYLLALIYLFFLIAFGIAESKQNTDSVRLDGQPNFSDIVGYQISDSCTIRRGLFYRAGELPRLTDEEIQLLRGQSLASPVRAR